MDTCVYSPYHNTDLHYAMIYKRGKLIAKARNRIGSRKNGSGWSDQTIHAEKAVVKKLGDVSQLRGSILVVVRVNKQNSILFSKPCSECECFLRKCMKRYGLLKVLYS